MKCANALLALVACWIAVSFSAMAANGAELAKPTKAPRHTTSTPVVTADLRPSQAGAGITLVRHRPRRYTNRYGAYRTYARRPYGYKRYRGYPYGYAPYGTGIYSSIGGGLVGGMPWFYYGY